MTGVFSLIQHHVLRLDDKYISISLYLFFFKSTGTTYFLLKKGRKRTSKGNLLNLKKETRKHYLHSERFPDYSVKISSPYEKKFPDLSG